MAIRQIKENKKSHILDLETSCFQEKTFYKTFLGNVLLNKSNFSYNNIKANSKLHYNKKTNIFTLLIPIETKTKPHEPTDNYMSIDPGVRTFLTCLTNNKMIEIGKDVGKYIYKKNRKIDKIRNGCDFFKKRIEKHKKQIRNKITDMHWKSIKYIVDENITNIRIGNWSTKRCISNDFNLHKTTKRVIQSLRYFEFCEKLTFKCKEYNVSLKIVDESYTSKTCSCCGIINKMLGSKKTFKCPHCNIKIDRDINGCRNILMKSL